MRLAMDDHSNEWLLRMGVKAGIPEAFTDFEKRLKATESTAERLMLTSTFTRLPLERRYDFLSLLAAKPTDDYNLAWLTWYAVEPLVAARPELVDSQRLDAIKIPLVRQNIVRRYLAAKSDEPALGVLSKALASAKNDVKRDILLGIREAYADRPTAKPLPGWDKLPLTGAGVSADVRALADELSIKFGDKARIEAMKERIVNKGDSADARRDAIRLLAGAKVDGMLPLLQQALADDTVRASAIRALASYPNDKTPAAILAVYGKLTADEKADAVQTLASRASYALALLSAVEKGDVPKADITAFTARQIAAIKDKAVQTKLASVWGEVKPASANRKALMTKYKGLLTPDKLVSANAANGRVLFAKNCATCHKLFDEGQAVGPELTGGQRSNLDYVLENVVDPSAAVANEYKMTQFYLADGRVVSGIVKKTTGNAVTVRTVNEEVVIPTADIDQKKPTQLSVMPEGLLDALKPDEVLDLVKYLMGKQQVPLPK